MPIHDLIELIPGCPGLILLVDSSSSSQLYSPVRRSGGGGELVPEVVVRALELGDLLGEVPHLGLLRLQRVRGAHVEGGDEERGALVVAGKVGQLRLQLQDLMESI